MIRIFALFLFLVMIFGCTDVEEHLGNGYVYISESPTDSVILREPWSFGDPLIYCNVVRYEFDAMYVIAQQERSEKCFWSITNAIQPEGEEPFFWIVLKGESVLLGPFEYDIFLKEKARLEIGLSF